MSSLLCGPWWESVMSERIQENCMKQVEDAAKREEKVKVSSNYWCTKSPTQTGPTSYTGGRNRDLMTGRSQNLSRQLLTTEAEIQEAERPSCPHGTTSDRRNHHWHQISQVSLDRNEWNRAGSFNHCGKRHLHKDPMSSAAPKNCSLCLCLTINKQGSGEVEDVLIKHTCESSGSIPSPFSTSHHLHRHKEMTEMDQACHPHSEEASVEQMKRKKTYTTI